MRKRNIKILLSSKKALTYSEDCSESLIKIYVLPHTLLLVDFLQCFPLIGCRKNPRNVRFINGFRNKQDHRRLSVQLWCHVRVSESWNKLSEEDFSLIGGFRNFECFFAARHYKNFKTIGAQFKNTDLIFKVLQKQYSSRGTIPLNAH